MSEFRVKPVMFSEAGAGRLWRFGVRRRERPMDALLCAIGPGTMLFCAETGGESEKAGIPPLAWSNGRGACCPGAAANDSPYWFYEWPLAGRLEAFA